MTQTSCETKGCGCGCNPLKCLGFKIALAFTALWLFGVNAWGLISKKWYFYDKDLFGNKKYLWDYWADNIWLVILPPLGVFLILFIIKWIKKSK